MIGRPRRRRMPGRIGAPRRNGKMRLIMMLVMAGAALFSYFGSKTYNAVTDEAQYISITTDQEIALGLQAAPQMIQQHGGLDPNSQEQALVDQVGQRLIQASPKVQQEGWQYDFHLLADANTINAFALPGGQIFITSALFDQLQTEGQLAGILGHEIGHVVARHSAQRIAKSDLTQGLIGAVSVGAENPQAAARIASIVGNLVTMKFGRDDELQSDKIGVQLMADAGYDPRSMIGVMEILGQAGSRGQPEFFSTHPNPDNRIQRIEATIDSLFPNGVPEGLTP